MNLFRSFLIVLFFTFSLFGDTYDNYAVSLTSGGYTHTDTVKANDIDRFTISIIESGYFSAEVSGNSTVKFDVSTTSMPDKLTHTLTSFGPVFYNAGQTVYLSSSAPGETSSQTYTLTLTLATGNQAPVAVNDAAETDGVNPTTIYVLLNDYDLDGTLNKASIVATDPADGNITIDYVNGTITYTPPSPFDGTDSFTYTVEDNEGTISDVATVSIGYPIPIAYDRYYSVAPTDTLVASLISDYPYGTYYTENNITVLSNTTPSVGNLSPNPILADGNFTYTYTGSEVTDVDYFTYSVTNEYGIDSNEANVTIFINSYCANAITLLETDDNCSDDDTAFVEESSPNGVTSVDGQYYAIVINEDGYLDINLTNTEMSDDKLILYYDFGDSCPTIFSKGTTSQLDSGYRSETATIEVDANTTYYLGLLGTSKTNATPYSVDLTFRSKYCGGGIYEPPPTVGSVGINEVENYSINADGECVYTDADTVDYDTNKVIKTKIVNKEFCLHASYLDPSGSVTIYDGQYSDKPNDTVDMTVILEHADGASCTDSKHLGQGIIRHGDEDTVIGALTIDRAYKDRRAKVTSYDWGALLENADGLNCNTSSLESSLCLVPACFNNVQNILSVFPPAFQDNVMRCIYGDGTAGTSAPCDSNAYNGNCGGRIRTISPSEYNTDFGCAMCLADAMQGDLCSEDNFAIRPNDFNTTMLPDPFKAGEAAPLEIYAEDYTGIASLDYNETEGSSFVVDINISDATKSCQDMNINFVPPVDFINGDASGNYALNNVGEFNLTMHERIGFEFAVVDADDTSDADRLIEPFMAPITVVPHHFGIDGGLQNGSNGFTYLSNFEQFPNDADRNISASFDVNVSAETLTNAVTSNYTAECYAKDGNLTLTLLDDINGSNPEAGSLTKLLWYHYTPDDNGSIPLVLGATEYNLPFSSTQFDSNDTNGTAEFNYKINFDRNTSKVVNPFAVVVNEINATDTDNVSGVNVGGNATFVYGRTHATRQRYQGDTGTANIYFESYCFGAGCDKTLLNGFSPNMQRTDDVRWYVNEANIPDIDGTVGIVQQKDATPTDASDDIVDVTAQNNVTYYSTADLDYDESKGYPYKTTMHNNASPWLIYNESDWTATRNEFQVEFDRIGEWTGEHNTSTTTKTPAGATTNRRIMW
ncbi:MAG: Ig-like domain-containing protein [Sulfurimonas sp.]|uniref:Ig-like domain-containing protein n=1 Tax=Sulfurimonas sp. TaxID=2022749 RepID=UPI0028CFBA02|nr:Ig-like domain-containing protein [Sulfurimonas sp.]MDT8338667.1 Ig-like domain-containing protein [Sulfurimonas sp.]